MGETAAAESTKAAGTVATTMGNASSEAASSPEVEQTTRPKRSRRKTAQLNAGGSRETGATEASEATTETSKMTVRELWALAKQRGVSVARTKTDFYRSLRKRIQMRIWLC